VSSLRFYARLYVLALRSRAEYRIDFAVGVGSTLAIQCASFAFYWVIFSHVPALGGWAREHVLFLLGMTAAVLGLSEMLLNGIWSLPQYLVRGQLDRLLLYPVHSLTFLLISAPEIHAFGNLLTGLVITVLALQEIDVPALVYVLVPVWLACGAVIYTALLVLAGSLSIVALGPWSQHFMLAQHLLNASRYPASIYPRWLQWLLVVALPVAVPIYLPGRWVAGIGSAAAGVLAPIVAAGLSAWVALWFWQRALRHYQSTGS